MTTRSIAFRYALFALTATGVNVATQRIVLAMLAGPLGLPVAMVCGTTTGLIVKYVLDCRWIFSYIHRPAGEHLVTFVLYGLMSGATTLVFWSVEFLFDSVFAAEASRYAGAVLGLALGYTLKYQLDRRFVFQRRSYS